MDGNAVRQAWHDRSGAYSPGYYAYYGADERSEAVRERLDERVCSDASVLELGCSAGRHLAHLYDHGFRNLTGVDINESAGDVLADTYPDLADVGRFRFDAIESVVPEFPDDRFDAVYSVETLQHIHPEDEWVFEEIARITGAVLVTVEIESGTAGSAADNDVNYVDDGIPLYYRDWGAVFENSGLFEVASTALGRDTVRTFRTDV